MSVSSNEKKASSRQKPTQNREESAVEVEKNSGESVSKDDKGVEIANMSPKEESNPKNEGNGKLIVAGTRPIASSDLQVAQTMAIAGLRPIGTSSLEVVESVNLMGIRPIAANNVEIVGTMNISGVRPISASIIKFSETYSVMGNRPIASNEIDDSYSLMGFLD